MADEAHDEIPDAVDRAADLLPGWFTSRMMTDNWTFGLLIDTGITIVIERIDHIYQAADGQLWLDVTLSDTHMYTPMPESTVLKAPTRRREASVAVCFWHIVAAFELADT